MQDFLKQQTMLQLCDVKEMLNTVKPEFNISTSCLYTYTKNYRKGTLQSKRHHHGREVNANVSLHKAPNTSEQVLRQTSQ